MKEKEEGKQEGEGRRTHTQKKTVIAASPERILLSCQLLDTQRCAFILAKREKSSVWYPAFSVTLYAGTLVFFSLLLFILFHFTFLTCLFFFFFSPCCSKMLGVTGCCTLLRNLGVFPCNRFVLTYILTHSETHRSLIVALCFFFCVYIDAKGKKEGTRVNC